MDSNLKPNTLKSTQGATTTGDERPVETNPNSLELEPKEAQPQTVKKRFSGAARRRYKKQMQKERKFPASGASRPNSGLNSASVEKPDTGERTLATLPGVAGMNQRPQFEQSTPSRPNFESSSASVRTPETVEQASATLVWPNQRPQFEQNTPSRLNFEPCSASVGTPGIEERALVSGAWAIKRPQSEQSTPSHMGAQQLGKRIKVSERTFGQVTPNELKIALVPLAYPEAKLEDKELNLLKSMITERILSLPKGTSAPIFRNTQNRDGAVIFNCSDEQTVTWIKGLVSELSVNGISLRALRFDELPKRHRIVVRIDDPKLSIKDALELLDRQNSDLNTEDWVMVKGSESRDAVSAYFAALIGNETLKALRALHFKPYCGLGQAMVKLPERNKEENTIGNKFAHSNGSWTYYATPFQSKARVIYALNLVVIPYGIIDWSLINDEPSFNYLLLATLGNVIAHQIAHHFDTNGIHYFNQTRNTQNTLMFENEFTDNNFDDYINCQKENLYQGPRNMTLSFTDQIVSFGIPQLTLNERLSEIMGLRLAYDTLALKSDAKRLPWIQLRIDQLFYLAYAQMYCTKMPLTSSYISLYESEDLPSRIRVFVSASNSKHLAEAWKCPLGSQIAPNEVCSVFPYIDTKETAMI